MSLATRINLIQESSTFAILNKANNMKKSGQDVIILAAGEPDFETPKHIKIAAIEAINMGFTKYTAISGTKELREAISHKFLTENSLSYTPEQIIVSNGAKHSIYNILQTILNDQDEVIIPAPYWLSYPDMVLLCGGKPIIVKCGTNDNFKITPEALAQAITARTKAIFLNSPSNPTGMVYSYRELQALAQVIKLYPNIYVISDDIYEHILFEDSFVNVANVSPELLDRIIVVNGVSKAYCMTGWRIGYAATTNLAIVRAMDKIQSQSTSNPCSISQHAACAALNSGTNCIKEMKNQFILRNDYVFKRLNQIKGINYIKAQGAFYAFFDCDKAIENLYNKGKITAKDDIALSNYLLDKHLVACVPGSAFGLRNFLRISFATNIDELRIALERIEIALDI